MAGKSQRKNGYNFHLYLIDSREAVALQYFNTTLCKCIACSRTSTTFCEVIAQRPTSDRRAEWHDGRKHCHIFAATNHLQTTQLFTRPHSQPRAPNESDTNSFRGRHNSHHHLVHRENTSNANDTLQQQHNLAFFLRRRSLVEKNVYLKFPRKPKAFGYWHAYKPRDISLDHW
jgi:hypothetical protein